MTLNDINIKKEAIRYFLYITDCKVIDVLKLEFSLLYSDLGKVSRRLSKFCFKRLKIASVNNLRVIDSSIMPGATNANLNAPTIMIGDTVAAEIISFG